MRGDLRAVATYDGYALMRAHKQNVTIAADREIAIRLPDDFPSGPAEIIVLSVPMADDHLSPPVRTLKPLKPHPVLGRIVFHEDPSLPLDPEDWPES
jgi:hypothetical protein